ncbi:MAG: hypothetical protein ABI718_12230 [Acidobacteriota bacterium]
MEKMLSRSTKGLVEVKQADGTVSMDLDGRFMNVLVLVGGDGGDTTSCHTNLESLKRAMSAPLEGSIMRRPVPARPSVPSKNKILEVQ